MSEQPRLAARIQEHHRVLFPDAARPDFGYQVCHKWLKDRRGREISAVDKAHYAKIVVALNETIRLMEEIDETMPGWPLE